MTNPISGFAQTTARWSATRPWRAIGLWLVFVVVAVALAMIVPTADSTDADSRHGDSGRAAAMIATAGFEDPDSEAVLLTAPAGSLDTVAARDAAAAITTRMSALAGVARVEKPILNPAGTALLVSVQLARGHADIRPLQEVTASVQRSFPGLRIREAGTLSADTAINDRVAQDLRSAEELSLPVTLVLMLLAFGALTAAGLPVLLAATSVAATIGLLAPLSHLIRADPTVSSLIVLIGMAVGVDYSLFYLKRAREERDRGRSTMDAVAIAAATSGHSIMVSGAAVIASMASLFVLGDATFASLAAGSILVVGVAVIGSITVLPALLVKLGRWVDRPRVPLLWRVQRRITRRVGQAPGQGGISRRVLAPVTRHPAVALVLSAAAVLLLALPGLGMRTHSANLETLPGSIPAVQTLRELGAEFPSQYPTADVVVHAPAVQQPAVAEALAELRGAAGRSGLFRASGVGARVSRDGATTELSLPMPFKESDPQVGTAIERLRSQLVPGALSGLDASYAVGGDAAESVDFDHQQHDRLPFVIGAVLLLTLLLMGINFRSVPIAVVSAVLNLASVGVAFGAITLVFQDGWFAGPLGFSSPGFVIDWLPVFVMAVLVGLSMDYHVFVLSRVREHVRSGLPTRLAVERGVAETAGVVTSAAAVMVSVFAIFATLSLLELKTMGVGLALAILVDATVIRLVMLPAILCLLGERAWWPVRRPQAVGTSGSLVDEPEPVWEAVGG